MPEAVIISRDPTLRQRIQGAAVHWVVNPGEFERALDAGFRLALVDICNCGGDFLGDIAAVVHQCRERGQARVVIGFLSRCGGDAAIQAHLAGADRVIPVDQLEAELPALLDG